VQAERGRVPGDQAAVAVDAADDLGDHERFIKTYFGEVEGCYFAGDGARKDEDGYFWVMGRVDDVINVAGHRLSTMEVESALVSHPKVAEAAVVGRPDDLKGQVIVAFVTPRMGVPADEALARELRDHVVAQIGALARPEELRFAEALPKTRSGKIMRRLLREVASGSKARGRHDDAGGPGCARAPRPVVRARGLSGTDRRSGARAIGRAD